MDAHDERPHDTMYTTGEYFLKNEGCKDAGFKIEYLRRILLRLDGGSFVRKVMSVADIGCGAGKTTSALYKLFKELTGNEVEVDGYDVHPFIDQLQGSDRVRFIKGDFAALASKVYDIAVLFDVIEHVSDPISFLGGISAKARYVVLHIPLDDSYFLWLRNLPRENLKFPGHLVALDPASALNLLTYSGLRVLDYEFTPGFRAPSGRQTILQKLLYPLRSVSFQVSPYLTHKLLAGVSLMVIGATKNSREKSARIV